MAMGQEQQRNLYPIFLFFSWYSCRISLTDSITDWPLSVNSIPQPTHPSNSSRNHTKSADKDNLKQSGIQWYGSSSQTGQAGTCQSEGNGKQEQHAPANAHVSIPDGDPNSGRRKRLKVEESPASAEGGVHWGGIRFSNAAAGNRPKSNDPVDPVWPPKELVHVRGTEDESIQSPKNTFHGHSDGRRKKDKVAAVGITDEEDVTVHHLHDAQWRSDECSSSEADDARQILRVPGRLAISGPVLKQAMVCEFLQSSTRNVADKGRQNLSSHPAIDKLVTSMAHSMTPFDYGESESTLWNQKYAPETADEVLQVGREAVMLRDWLNYLTISAVETGKARKDGKDGGNPKRRPRQRKPNKRRKKTDDDLDDFIVSSSDEQDELGEVTESEDELAGDVTVSSKRTLIRQGDLNSNTKVNTKGQVSNAILLSGPSGCGKTASVYAVAKELGFEVFELNAGNRRSAKDVVERVGDMAQNHLVHNLSRSEGISDKKSDGGSQDVAPKQNKMMMNFFQPLSKKNSEKRQDRSSKKEESTQNTDSKRTQSQKQSLILLEEADVLFEEDKQFWSGVMDLIGQSKRPIVITCNDENLVPMEEIFFHGILRYRKPTPNLAIDYMLLVAANEGHILKPEAVSDLYLAYGEDLRRSLMDLNFWCQMGVGSKKSGLDWIIPRCTPGSDLDENGHALRAISLNTYEHYMGWFSRDIILTASPFERQAELDREALNWWQLDVQNALTQSDGLTPQSNDASPDALRHESERADAQSVLDILGDNCSLDFKQVCFWSAVDTPMITLLTTMVTQDAVDISVPLISDKQRANYIEGYPLLQADLEPNYSTFSTVIPTTFEGLLTNVFFGRTNDESSQASKVVSRSTQEKVPGLSKAECLEVFTPIIRADCILPQTGRLAPSFENGIAQITEDLAPYVRAIVAYDMRLEKYRSKLGGLLSRATEGNKRMRRTRASRAALEGGDKAFTRKEKWFDVGSNAPRILNTGKSEWQEALVQQGYFTVGSMDVQKRDVGVSDSSESGGL